MTILLAETSFKLLLNPDERQYCFQMLLTIHVALCISKIINSMYPKKLTALYNKWNRNMTHLYIDLLI